MAAEQPPAAEGIGPAAVPSAATSPNGAAPEAASADRGLLVWESNRSGAWRIWLRPLAEDAPTQLTADEPGRRHCCPHLSPDGSRLVYLSLVDGRYDYPGPTMAGELRLLDLATGAERTLAPAARTYLENRAAVWQGRDAVAFIDADGRSVRIEVASGERESLTAAPRAEYGWLIDPTGSFATAGLPSFAPYRAERRAVAERTPLGGCQPYFSHDGRWGYWTAGVGGPLNRIALASREIGTILGKSDARLPDGLGYLYFPMLSADGRLFAFGASRGEHDHHASDYEILLAETDPATLELLSLPIRMTSHPATDRFPDVWGDPAALGGLRRPLPAPDAPAAAAPAAGPQPWPSSAEGLLFAWQTGYAANLVFDPALGADRASLLEPSGRAHLDHDFAMVADDGAFSASDEEGARLRNGLQVTNTMTIEAVVTRVAGEAGGSPHGRLLALTAGGEQNFALWERNGKLGFTLRVGSPRRPNSEASVELAELAANTAIHVALTYTPGRTELYLDGEPVAISDTIQGDFFHFRNLRLVVGDGSWDGTVEGVAIWNRILSAAKITEDARRYIALREQRPTVARSAVEARPMARSATPTLQQISPYRQALAVVEYQVVRQLAGEPLPATIRVAEWAILDGKTVALGEAAEETTLSLERFTDNLQLEPLYLSDTLPAAAGELYYRVAR